MNTERGLFGRLIREPLLHFFLIGGVVFAAYRPAGPQDSAAHRRIIEVTAAQEERLAGQFESVWQRPPTRAEQAGLLGEHVREEVYYREALALGLDRDDTVIRRRLRQKMEFLGHAGADALEPDEAELTAHLAAHPDRFQRPARITFRQVLLDGADPAAVLAKLETGTDPLDFGRSTLLPPAMEGSAQPSVDGTFGAGFFAAVAALEPGSWAGPITSAFGVHLVELLELEPGAPPRLQAVRRAVEEDWRRVKAEELREAQYQSLRARYEVILPPERPR